MLQRCALILTIAAAMLRADSYSLFPIFYFTLPLSVRFVPSYVPAYGVQIQTWLVAADRIGNLYIVDQYARIRKVTRDGILIPLTGFGPTAPAPGQRISGLLANTVQASAIATDTSGNVFIAGGRFPANTVYRLTPDRILEIYATSSEWSISGLSTDASGNVYVANTKGPLVKVVPDGAVITVTPVPATGVAAAEDGTLYISNTDPSAPAIQKVDLAGNVTTFASFSGQLPLYGLALDQAGNVYFSQGSPAAVVRKVTPDGAVETVAGGGASPGIYGVPATQTTLAYPLGVAVDLAGNLYIGGSGPLQQVDTNGILRIAVGCACAGDGVPASWAEIISPVGIVADISGNIYFSDFGTSMVRRIAADGTITTVAGIGEPGFSGDGGPAREARLFAPAGLALDTAGRLYIADEQNHRIRRVELDGSIQTVAGNGVAGSGGDGGLATAAGLAFPDGVAVDTAGNVYIADTANHRIRKVASDGTIQTVAGTGQPGLAGDGGSAAQALLLNPRMLAFDNAGNLLFTDTAEHVVRRVTPAGIIERVAGTGQPGSAGDGGPATAAQIGAPWGIAVDSAGNVLIGDMSFRGGRIRMVDTAGIMHALGSGLANGLAVDTAGRIWMATGFGYSYGLFLGGTVNVASRIGPPFSTHPVIYDGAISQAGTPNLTGAMAPGESISIYGFGLAPDGPGGATESPAAVQVLFNGEGVSPYYVSATRLDVVVPPSVARMPTVRIAVSYQGRTSNTSTLDVLPCLTYGCFGPAAEPH